MIKNTLYVFLSIWLSVIGALLGLLGQSGEWIFKQIKHLGIGIIKYSFKYDNF